MIIWRHFFFLFFPEFFFSPINLLGSQPKNRVGRVTGSTTINFFCLSMKHTMLWLSALFLNSKWLMTANNFWPRAVKALRFAVAFLRYRRKSGVVIAKQEYTKSIWETIHALKLPYFKRSNFSQCYILSTAIQCFLPSKFSWQLIFGVITKRVISL